MSQQNILYLLCHFSVVSGVMTLNAASSTTTSSTLSPVNANTSVTASPFSAVQTSSLSSAVSSVASNTLSAASGAVTSTTTSSQTPSPALPFSSTGHVSSASTSASASPTTSPAGTPSAIVTPTAISRLVNTNTSAPGAVTSTSPAGTPSAPANGITTASPSKDDRVVGFVIAYFVIFAVVAVTLYWISRPKKTDAEKGNEFEMDASALCGSAATSLGHTKEPEVGINHQAFVEDSESPENVAAHDIHIVKVAEDPNFPNDTAF